MDGRGRTGDGRAAYRGPSQLCRSAAVCHTATLRDMPQQPISDAIGTFYNNYQYIEQTFWMLLEAGKSGSADDPKERHVADSKDENAYHSVLSDHVKPTFCQCSAHDSGNSLAAAL